MTHSDHDATPSDGPTLEELRAENKAAYAADIHTGGYEARIARSNALYIPALEAEVRRLSESAGQPLVTFVTWDAETDGVALKIDGEVVWRERSWESLSQAPIPLGVPVVIAKEVTE